MISLSLRYLEGPVIWIRYRSDSSYWLYFVHVPLLLWVQVWVAPVPLPALLKGLLALAVALPLMLIPYHFAVRSTWLGLLLKGHRYSRGGRLSAAICKTAQV